MTLLSRARARIVTLTALLIAAGVLLSCEEAPVVQPQAVPPREAPTSAAISCVNTSDGSEMCRVGNVTIKRNGSLVQMSMCQQFEASDGSHGRMCVSRHQASTTGVPATLDDLAAEAVAFSAQETREQVTRTFRNAERRVQDTAALESGGAPVTSSPLDLTTEPVQILRDSAGIQIIENRNPQLPSTRAWRLSAAAILDIGVTGGASEYEFQTIMGVVRLADQNLVVADMGSSQLRWYDARGRFVRAVGRAGQGPGEFGQLLGVQHLRNDSILALNGPASHDLFTADGRYVGRIRPEIPAATGSSQLLSIRGWFDDGTAVLVQWSGTESTASRGVIITDSARLFLWRRPSTSVGTIGPVPTQNRGTSAAETMHVTFGPVGHGAAQGQYYYWGFGSEYALKGYDSRGKLIRIIRRSWIPRIVSATELQAWKDHYVNPRQAESGDLPTDYLYQLRTRNLGNMIISKSLPAFTHMIADRAGNLWLRESRVTHFYVEGSFSAVPREPSEFSVFDPSGRWLCNVTVPAGVKVMEIGADYITGVRKDVDDVEHVVVYRLEKP